MNHEHYEELINLYIDNGLSDRDSVGLFAHLSACGPCRQLSATALRVRAHISREKLVEVPVSLDARVTESIRAARSMAPDRAAQPRAVTGRGRLLGVVAGLSGKKVPVPLVTILLVAVLASTLIFTSTWNRPEKQPAQFQPEIVYVPRLPAIQVLGFYPPNQKSIR